MIDKSVLKRLMTQCGLKFHEDDGISEKMLNFFKRLL